ncbi:hypothetical protein JW935_15845 [candidate division KSB1 bacterium]|nr:hypothetical protein [candidate division KSB1 bacterium]
MKRFPLFLICFIVLNFVVVVVAQDNGTTPEYPPLPTAVLTVLGVFAPVAIQLATKRIPKETPRFLISLLLSGVSGVIAMLIAGFKISTNPEMIALWFTWTTVVYKTFWKNLWKNPASVLHAESTQ